MGALVGVELLKVIERGLEFGPACDAFAGE